MADLRSRLLPDPGRAPPLAGPPLGAGTRAAAPRPRIRPLTSYRHQRISICRSKTGGDDRELAQPWRRSMLGGPDLARGWHSWARRRRQSSPFRGGAARPRTADKSGPAGGSGTSLARGQRSGSLRGGAACSPAAGAARPCGAGGACPPARWPEIAPNSEPVRLV
jgi:hypothetical protein